MTRVELTEARAPLADYARKARRGPVVLTRRGRPIALLRLLTDEERENFLVSTHPGFVEMIRRSREGCPPGSGVALEDVERELGVLQRGSKGGPMDTIEVGELLYEYTVKLAGMTEYGISFASLMAGTAAPPPEGARFDVPFEGTSVGPKLKGKVTGVDYLRIRADGRFELHIHAEVTTDDGHKISLHADGVALPQQGSPIAGLRENVTLFTSSKAYSWVNGLQVWGTGTVDLGEQVVRIKGYSA